MNALQVTGPNALEYADLSPRKLESREVRIKVAVSCLCGSDLKNLRNPVQVPQTLGHEFSGTVTELSKDTDGRLGLGQAVTAFPMIACLKCKACQNQQYRDCDEKLSLGFQKPGSFADEVILDERFVISLKSGINLEEGALLEHFCCGYRLAKEIIKQHSSHDTKIIIIGDGPIALADIQSLKVFGYKNIDIIGKHNMRIQYAEKIGAKSKTSEEALREKYDACILAAPAEVVLEKILPSICDGGTIYPQTRILNTNLLDKISHKKINLGRAFAYAMEDFYEVMEHLINKKINFDHLINRRISLQEAAKEILKPTLKDESIKVAIYPQRG